MTAVNEPVQSGSSNTARDRSEEEGLPRELLEEFIKHGQRRTFSANAEIVREGDPADTLYLIIEGTVRVFASDAQGREIELNQLGPDQYFGELMLASSVRTANVCALTPTTTSMIRRAEFERAIAARPDIAFHVIQTLIRRVRALTDNVRSLALMDVYGRIARVFLEQAEEIDGEKRLPFISQQRIAERVGSSRSMVNRVMKDLVEGGYIEVTRAHIRLKRTLPKRW